MYENNNNNNSYVVEIKRERRFVQKWKVKREMK